MSNQQADVRQHEQEMREAFEEKFGGCSGPTWDDKKQGYVSNYYDDQWHEWKRAWQAATLAAEDTFNQRLVELTSRIRDVCMKVAKSVDRSEGDAVPLDLEAIVNLVLTESNFTSSLERQYKENQR